MNVSKVGVDINKRFFEAIDVLIAQRRIRGLQTFTREFGINRWNMGTVRGNAENSVLKVEWIYYLCQNYGVSTDWVILNKGGMFDCASKSVELEKPQPASKQDDGAIVGKYIGKNCRIVYRVNLQQRKAIGLLVALKYDESLKRICLQMIKENGRKVQLNMSDIISIKE